MTQEDVIEIAIQLGFSETEGLFRTLYICSPSDLKAFAKLIAAKEREACAQILANTDLSGLKDHPLQNWVAGMLFEFIKAIRARGEA